MVSFTRYLVQIALLPMWDKQAGALTNDSMNTNVWMSQVTVPTQHWQSTWGHYYPVDWCNTNVLDHHQDIHGLGVHLH